MNDDDFAELFKQLNSGPSAGTSWADVGAEVQALGKTLADSVRAAWRRQESDERLRDLQAGLQSMIENIDRQVEGTPEAQQARDQLGRVADSLRDTAERASAELRPQLVEMLRQANAELKRLTGLEQ